MPAPRSLLVILGNQLFAPQHLPPPSEVLVFMAEDVGLCTYVRHHQQKIVLFLAAMRNYAEELRQGGYDVHYEHLDVNSTLAYEDRLQHVLDDSSIVEIQHFEIEDKPMEARLVTFSSRQQLRREELPSPMFLCSRQDFASYAAATPRLLMGDFYKQQRKRHGILVDSDHQPAGGRWSFDTDNRKKLPRALTPPKIPAAGRNPHVDDLVALVKQTFPDHPGDAAEFWWPTTRAQAHAWLDDFVTHRLESFGPYEDAMTTRSATVFHSALSPCLNMGLLTPADIVDRALREADKIPLQSLEGFLRQVIGWREFIRGIYRNFSTQQESGNFWNHDRELTTAWYEGATGILPLDDAIHTARRLGWTHHIPRLMILGNLMTLCEIKPESAHRWFMEMFVDSSEWVMGPNVYGMGIFSDGGLFATKPYICGSNYLLKMSDYAKGPWCNIVDGLYWRFIDKHRDFFGGNPRLALMPRALDRLDPDRRLRIFAAAEEFLVRQTLAGGNSKAG